MIILDESLKPKYLVVFADSLNLKMNTKILMVADFKLNSIGVKTSLMKNHAVVKSMNVIANENDLL
jgi:hypothetical protein